MILLHCISQKKKIKAIFRWHYHKNIKIKLKQFALKKKQQLISLGLLALFWLMINHDCSYILDFILYSN